MDPRPLLAGLLLAAFALSGCIMDDENGDEPDDGQEFDRSGGSDTNGSAGDLTEDRDADHIVKMPTRTVFEPDDLTIGTNDTVVWNNTANLQHTVTSIDDGPLDSGAPGSADGYSHTFVEPGQYRYRCTVHSFQDDQGGWTGMVGSITVENETSA